jgi:hypothetical protein
MSDNARHQRVTVPYSEAAMHCRVAGRELDAFEEDTYMNGEEIPLSKRNGCYVMFYNATAGVVRIPLLKSEAGWED